MIRRKIWATATVCLALSGAAQAQTGAAPTNTLTTPSYPRYVPRGYVAPTSPTYAAPAQPTMTGAPMMAEPVAPPAPLPIGQTLPADAPILFAAEQDPKTTPTGPAPMPMGAPTPPMPMAPMPMGKADSSLPTPMAPKVMPGAPMATPGVPMGTVVEGAPVMTGPLVSGPINGGPIVEGCSGTPFLDGFDGGMPQFWVSGEYLNWRFRGANIKPLVTIAPAGSPGTLSDPGTAVVFGGDDRQSDWQPGFRFRAGTWIEGGGGLDVGFFWLDRLKDGVVVGSNGDPGIFRPFFNTGTGFEDAALVAFVDPVFGPVVTGRAAVLSTTELWGADANYRSGWDTGLGGRFDTLVGLRYARLEEELKIQSNLTTLVAAGAAPAGTLIVVSDSFRTRNQFVGPQVGFVAEWLLGNMTFGLRGTFAAGATFQKTQIAGSSGSVFPGGGQVAAAGGVLALPSNSGDRDHTAFSILPEAGVTIGYQVMNNLRVFAGYNVLSWTNVARAGEQINRRVNGTFIPDPTTGTAAGVGAAQPVFKHHESSFWVHGWSLGAEWRW